jgi:hypothetical protein
MPNNLPSKQYALLTYSQWKTIIAFILFAIVCSIELSLIGCGPIPVSVGEHEVTPDVNTNVAVPLSELIVSAPADSTRVSEIAAAIEAAGVKVGIVNGTDCMAAFLSDDSEHLPLPLSRFLDPDYKSRVTDFDIDYIVVLGESLSDSHETEIVTTVIDYHDASQAGTAQLHAEGNMRAFWPILPYIALFVFYSEPDTQSGMADKIGSVVARLIQHNRKGKQTRLLILESENLAELTKSVPRFVADSDDHKQKNEETLNTNEPAKIYDPVEMYKVLIGRGEGWDEDDPMTVSMPYNPLAHLIAIPTVIMLTPMLWIIDKTLVEKSQGSTYSTTPVSTHPSRWDFLVYSEKAIKRQDWEAAYRLLEDGLVSSDDVINYQSHQVLKRYPELMDGAKESFSEQSFRETLSKHGDAAFKLEEQRLAIYRTVASLPAYADAEQNFTRVFYKPRNDGTSFSE